eukprot:m.91084 g.91084  ORF g.91084 m.91084 type:complete len:334 (-) comp18200_c0_seq1:57-1058(-)
MMRLGGEPSTAADELFTRVMQFGAFSPVYTNWGNVDSDDNIWTLPEPYLSATVIALTNRNRLLPYRYTLSKVAHDTGVGPIRPMYYHFPLVETAYNAPQQYMIGPDILVAPIYSPVNPSSNTSSIAVWFPPLTDWVDFNFPGRPLYSGAAENGSWVTLNYTIAEVPVFVRAGAVLPLLAPDLAQALGAAGRTYASVDFVVYPPAPAPAPVQPAGTAVYEDDGMSNGYLQDEYSWTYFNATHSPGACSVYSIQTAGHYTDMPPTRPYTLHLLGAPTAATSVAANGVPLARSTTPPARGSGMWQQITAAGGSPAEVVVACQPAPLTSLLEIKVCF